MAVTGLQAEKAGLTTALHSAETQSQRSGTDWGALESQYKLQLDHLQSELSATRQALSDAKAEKERIELDAGGLNQSQMMVLICSDNKKEYERLNGLVEGITAELKTIKGENRAYKDELQKLGKCRKKCTRLKQEVEEREKKLAALREEKERCEDTISDMERRAERLSMGLAGLAVAKEFEPKKAVLIDVSFRRDDDS